MKTLDNFSLLFGSIYHKEETICHGFKHLLRKTSLPNNFLNGVSI